MHHIQPKAIPLKSYLLSTSCSVLVVPLKSAFYTCSVVDQTEGSNVISRLPKWYLNLDLIPAVDL